ncbi:MAG: MoxR family ATPase [Candidatus Dormibacteraeota bacterium]|nr:MoxR family ATPase [Candidatus Dormibacteraeota bacterium]
MKVEEEAVETVRRVAEPVLENVGRAVVGKDEEVRHCLITLLCRGHLLIEDVPGVGKTMLAKALARSLDCTFQRVQFTPDLLPSDVTGVRAFNQKLQEFEFLAGPVFAQVVLADEINRATPKTQAALLEAMEEHTVTVDGETRDLPQPFIVMATQNPIEYAGTFPLPEAQLDRFFMRVRLGYLDLHGETALLGKAKVDAPLRELQPVVSPEELSRAQAAVADVHVAQSLREYLVRLVSATRYHADVALGASTRGTLHLYHAAQARAAMEGRTYVIPEDIKELADPVLAHRLILRPNADLQGSSASKILHGIVLREPVPHLSDT